MKWLRKTYVAIVMAFLYAPILVLIVFSFNKSKSRGAWTGFTLSWYQRLFTNEAIIQSLINTLVVALISSVLATVIGTLAADWYPQYGTAVPQRRHERDLHASDQS